MELNNIHKDLKIFYKDYSNTYEIIGFCIEPKDIIKRNIDVFRLGYWSLAPFAYSPAYNYCIRLNPRFKTSESSIVYFKNSDPITMAPNFKCFLPFINLLYFDDIDFIEEDIKANWTRFIELSLPFQKYSNNLEPYKFLKEYIDSSKINDLLENPDKGYPKIFMDFWNHYNNTSKQQSYSEMIFKLVNDKRFLPELEEIDYGIWNDRINCALAQRAYSKLKVDFNNVEKYYWNYLTQQHGFDALNQDFGIVPNPSSDTYLSMRGILNQFDTDPNLERTFSEEVLQHPLYDAVQDLRVKKSGYTGDKHFEAAKVLDKEYEDPYASWDALVTASYWAGKNKNEAVEAIWEAAILLSKKEKWIDIYEILLQQYEYYTFYKNKI